MTVIPKTHPRAESLLVRERLVAGFKGGLVAAEGLMAHGRGEAFDYLVGERTTEAAGRATRAAAACMLLARRPVISVNGNFAALCAKEAVALAEHTGARIEVNLFYADRTRRRNIIGELERNGAGGVLGDREERNVRLSGLDSARRVVDADGIYSADVVLVPLEDGDRAEALAAAGKTVVAFDLNPLSRTAQAASITIVDNVTRGVANLVRECGRLAGEERGNLRGIVDAFDNGENLESAVMGIREGLAKRGRGCTEP